MADDRDRLFEELLAYYKRVVAYLRHCGFAPEDVRELAQDVYVRVYERMGEYRHEAHWSYLQKVARTIALNAIRDRHAAKRDAVLESEDKLADVSDDRFPAPDWTAQRNEESKLLHQAIERLDETLKAPLMLYLAGLSYLEIGKALGISQAALKSRLNVTRTKLRDLLGQDPKGPGGSDDQ
jgi:RNA polymerase sigma-70 factor (ECF subfamily)